MLLKLPLTGDLTTKVEITEISRSLGTMINAGVPLLKAIDVGRYISENLFLQELLKNASLEVKRGGRLSDALAKSGIFPELFVYMIGVGEETGKLGSMLLQIAENFEEETKRTLNKFIRAFEPLMILIMGIVIGFIIVAMLLPVLGINTISF